MDKDLCLSVRLLNPKMSPFLLKFDYKSLLMIQGIKNALILGH